MEDKIIAYLLYLFAWIGQIWEFLNSNVLALIALWTAFSWAWNKISTGYKFTRFGISSKPPKYRRVEYSLILTVRRNPYTTKKVKIKGVKLVIVKDDMILDILAHIPNPIEFSDDGEFVVGKFYSYEKELEIYKKLDQYKELWLIIYGVRGQIFCVPYIKSKPFVNDLFKRWSLSRKIRKSIHLRYISHPIEIEEEKLRILYVSYKIEPKRFVFWVEVKNYDEIRYYFIRNAEKNGILMSRNQSYIMTHMAERQENMTPDKTVEIAPLERIRLRYELSLSQKKRDELIGEYLILRITDSKEPITNSYFLKIEKKLADSEARVHDINYWNDLAYARIKDDDLVSALECYSKAIDINPRLAFLYYNRGNVNSWLDRDDNAIDDYTTAIRLDSGDYKSYVERGKVYLRKGNYDLSIGDFEKAILIKPNNPYAYEGRGQAFAKLGRQEEALNDFQKSYEIGYVHARDNKLI